MEDWPHLQFAFAVSHLDSDQSTELLQCLPNNFQSSFSLIAKIMKPCQGVYICTAKLTAPVLTHSNGNLTWNGIWQHM